MASQPDPAPDRIDPQSPEETPNSPIPEKALGVEGPEIQAPAPDVYIPDTAPPEITPDQFSG